MTATLALTVCAAALASGSGLAGVALRRRPALGQRLSCALLCLAAALGLGAAAAVLGGADPSSIALPWSPPGASLSLRLDALAAIFLLPILGIPALAAVYGLGYWPQERLGGSAVRLQLAFGLLTGSMALLVLAANALLFLTAWELMAVASFLLVLAEHDRPEAQRAAFLYLAATHVGTFALLAAFCLAGHRAASFDFAAWKGLAATGPGGTACFALAVAGFGMKAGLMPLHFWLPPAHAAAPSHVSAVMSGVLLETGIYGILRLTGLFAWPTLGWGMWLGALGAASAVLGIAFALGQGDLKRLLAWSSAENVGIIAVGAGLALVGRSVSDPSLVLFGFAGCALHVVNHALAKSLLFLGAGAVQHACGTRELDRLGGLGRAMPATALLVLTGAAALSGLPPLNGFVSEWLLALGALRALRRPAGDPAAFAALALPALALASGLAAACFAKLHGTAFLGQPRAPEAARAHEPPRTMLLPMAALAAACAAIGLTPALWTGPLARAAAAWSGLPLEVLARPLRLATASAAKVGFAAVALVGTAAALAFLRLRLAGSAPRNAETWSCGFAAPTPRMQYTGSSFAEILVGRFSWALRPAVTLEPPRGYLPLGARFRTEVTDPALERGLAPAARLAERLTGFARPFLLGPRIQFHALLILATLVLVLAWRFALR